MTHPCNSLRTACTALCSSRRLKGKAEVLAVVVMEEVVASSAACTTAARQVAARRHCRLSSSTWELLAIELLSPSSSLARSASLLPLVLMLPPLVVSLWASSSLLSELLLPPLLLPDEPKGKGEQSAHLVCEHRGADSTGMHEAMQRM